MADELTALEDWLEPLLQKLSQAELRKLTRTLAVGLRQRQAARIRRQENPDGTPFTPRKPRKTEKAGRIKRRRQMFQKLRQARHMLIRSDADGAEIGFRNPVANVARIHQKGTLSRVAPGGPLFQYPARRILGLSDDDNAWILETVSKHLAE